MANTFAEILRKKIDDALQDVNRECYKITKDLFTSIVDLSPSPTNKGYWADGLLVNQWYPQEGRSFSEAVGADTSPFGNASRSRINSLSGKQFFRKDGSITMANNLHYAIRAEKLGWPNPDENGNPTRWTGTVKAYRMIARSLQIVLEKYK